MLPSDVTGVILAGGRARRLGGVPKGLLERGGRPIVAGTIDTLGQVAGDCLLVTDDPGPYLFLGTRIIPDAVHGVGPAGGVLAALEHIATPFALVVGCDMPGVSAGVLAVLRDREARFDVVVPEVGGLVEPLCARWARAAAPVLRQALADGVRKMSSLMGRLLLERVPESVLLEADPQLALLGNVNTPEDADRLGVTRGRLIR